MQADFRQLLSGALADTNEEYARMVLDRMTRIELYPAPFLKHHQIYRVEHLNPRKPILFYVGFVPGEPAYLLTGKPGNYIQLAKTDGLVVDSPEVAENYVAVYLEVTRSMSRLSY